MKMWIVSFWRETWHWTPLKIHMISFSSQINIFIFIIFTTLTWIGVDIWWRLCIVNHIYHYDLHRMQSWQGTYCFRALELCPDFFVSIPTDSGLEWTPEILGIKKYAPWNWIYSSIHSQRKCVHEIKTSTKRVRKPKTLWNHKITLLYFIQYIGCFCGMFEVWETEFSKTTLTGKSFYSYKFFFRVMYTEVEKFGYCRFVWVYLFIRRQTIILIDISLSSIRTNSINIRTCCPGGNNWGHYSVVPSLHQAIAIHLVQGYFMYEYFIVT